MGEQEDDEDDFASLAPELQGRIWDLSDGRLHNGKWLRFGKEKTLLPFSASVEEYQAAMEAELQGPSSLRVGEVQPGDFIRQLKEEEELRDRRAQRKSAPVVAFFAGSLNGVTAPIWEVEDEKGKLHEFTSAKDAKIFQKEVREKIGVKERYSDMKKRVKVAAATVQSFKVAASGQQKMPESGGSGGSGQTAAEGWAQLHTTRIRRS